MHRIISGGIDVERKDHLSCHGGGRWTDFWCWLGHRVGKLHRLDANILTVTGTASWLTFYASSLNLEQILSRSSDLSKNVAEREARGEVFDELEVWMMISVYRTDADENSSEGLKRHRTSKISVIITVGVHRHAAKLTPLTSVHAPEEGLERFHLPGPRPIKSLLRSSQQMYPKLKQLRNTIRDRNPNWRVHPSDSW